MTVPGDFEYAVRYTKGEEKVCVLDRNPWLAKMTLPKLLMFKVVYMLCCLSAIQLLH